MLRSEKEDLWGRFFIHGAGGLNLLDTCRCRASPRGGDPGSCLNDEI
jgi:hypothetical protein